MGTKFLLVLVTCALLSQLFGFTGKRRTLRVQYLRLLTEARALLSQYCVRSWPELLARWERQARFAPWMQLRYLARITRNKLGGMGSLGDVVIFRDGKSDDEANRQLLEIVKALHKVTLEIIG
jgi:hypothetical protein